MGVKKLSAEAFGGNGVKIAILDSGVPPPILRGSWIEDVSGYYKEFPDTFGHATEISSLLFGGGGIIGICEYATPVFIQVLDSNGNGSVDDVVEGIYRAICEDVDLINLSLGFSRTEKCPKALEKACEKAYEAGKTIICAAGNDGNAVNWPAALETTVCVGSSGLNGLKTSFSSHGEVDFVAPGLNLNVLGLDGRIKTVSGTSFSAALVTGVAALLMHGLKESGDKIRFEDVVNALIGLADDVCEPGWDSQTGFGLISGGFSDSTVGMKMKRGFFDRILSKARCILGLNKRSEHGRV